MLPVPCIFTYPEQFPDKVMFALYIAGEGVCPVRGIAINKVQGIFAPRKTLPAGFRIHLKGDEALRLLSELDMLDPILHSMAEDIGLSFKKPKWPRKKVDKAAFEEQLRDVHAQAMNVRSPFA